MIVSGIGALAALLFGGQMPTPEQWTMFGGLIVAGFGLVNAADHKNVGTPAPQQPSVTPPPAEGAPSDTTKVS